MNIVIRGNAMSIIALFAELGLQVFKKAFQSCKVLWRNFVDANKYKK